MKYFIALLASMAMAHGAVAAEAKKEEPKKEAPKAEAKKEEPKKEEKKDGDKPKAQVVSKPTTKEVPKDVDFDDDEESLSYFSKLANED